MNQRGFTLIEVVIAVFIFAMISLGTTSVLSTLNASSEVTAEKGDRLTQLQRAFLVIERDVLQMTKRSVRLNGEAPLSRFIFSNESTYSTNTHGIAFVRKGWRNPGLLLPRSDVQAVMYQLEETTLNRLHYTFVDSVIGTEPKVRPLLDNVEQVDFEFYNGKNWVKSLPETELPLALAIEITLPDMGVIRRQFLVPGVIQEQGANDD
ncbi:type II secretion system minor pseudopilin GspJ [Thalassotalea ponticola]|uniref:type II secretion system minor pseudopilin GspJ n=1 Tax=Thalassotalea ponticola TaxID=1523392 RepID=UPI0025B3AD70|nr:type II secretion system minor pseudopilin GspJ [Thalassotalea ponticola]MDN3653001.1 type II secretion system minor pseudopilin GspJ [Thalassotalea ponticola]